MAQLLCKHESLSSILSSIPVKKKQGVMAHTYNSRLALERQRQEDL